MAPTQEQVPAPEDESTAADVESDPKLDDPADDADQIDEGTASDWTSEGGATQQGPATKPAAAHEPGS